MPESDPFVEIIVCPKCVSTRPRTLEGLREVELTPIRTEENRDGEGTTTIYGCPRCKNEIMWVYDYGEIDFGTMQPDLTKENSVVFETFEPLVKPPTLDE